MATTDTTTDLVIIDAANVDEDPSTGSEIAKTLVVGAASSAVVVGLLIAYNRFKPRVVAYIARKKDNEDPMVVEGTVIETPKTQKV